MKKLLLALSISFLTIAAVYALLPVAATAGVSPSPVMQSAPTSCLRLYQYQVVTNSDNLYYWISATLDGNTLLPPAEWTDERNHVITVTGWTASDWGVRGKQYVSMPSVNVQRSNLIGADPVLPHTITIKYRLVSSCVGNYCGGASIKIRLYTDKYGNGVWIHNVNVINGYTVNNTVTVVFSDTTYTGLLIETDAYGGGSPNRGSGEFWVEISSTNNTQCYVPPPTGYFRPVREGELVFDNQRFAEWTVTDTENTLVYAPTAGRVVDVQDKFVEISSTTDLGKYRVISVRAPTDLIGRDIDAGCVLGYFSDAEGVGQDNGVIVYTIVPVSPTIGSRLILTPTGGSCMESWECFREIWWEGVPGVTKAITLALPARTWAGYRYSVDFNSAVTAGAVLFQASNPRAETYFNLEIRQQPSGNLVWGPGIIQIDRPDKSDYVVSPTTFADGANHLAWALNPIGAADLHRVCVLSLFGGDLAGFCPSPAEDGWVLGQNAVWQGQKARLSDGGWIWKEVTIFLPPSPSSVAGAQGEDGAVGVGDVEPTAISGRYEARVRAKPLAGSPTIYLEKELAPGVWKTLEAVSVTQEAYYNISVQFDTGQQFLTIRLRASGGEVLVSEVCSEEEERESELIEPCFGIRPYNPAPLTCNILECPREQVIYHVRKFHDEAILPPLCKIAYWINYLYYYALKTVGKPILMYLTTITELIREYGPVRGIVEAFKILLESLWVSLIKPYGGQLVAWLWRVLQPVIDFLGISEYTLKLLQQFFSLLFTLFRKAFIILANGTVGLVRAAWLGFRQGLTATPTTPPVPPESIQLGMELIGYAYGNLLIVPLTVVFAGLIMWKFFFWSLRVLGVVR